MTATTLEGRVAALEAQVATMSNRISYLTSVLTKFQTITPPRVPIVDLEYRGQHIHAVIIDGALRILALDVAKAFTALGLWRDARGIGRTDSQKLAMQFGLKLGVDILSIPLGEVAAALGVTGPIVIGSLGTGGARTFMFLTEQGVKRIGEAVPQFAKWVTVELTPVASEVAQ